MSFAYTSEPLPVRSVAVSQDRVLVEQTKLLEQLHTQSALNKIVQEWKKDGSIGRVVEFRKSLQKKTAAKSSFKSSDHGIYA